MARVKARLLAFEGWMHAALRGDDWGGPLQLSAEVLGARAAHAFWRDDGGVSTSISQPGAPPRFITCCRELDATQRGVLEHHEPGVGRIVWARAHAEPDFSSGELALFALFEDEPDVQLLREIAAVAANGFVTKMRLDAARAASALKMAAFDQLPFGVVIVDAKIRIAERNEACCRLLARADGLSAKHDRLLCREEQDQSALFVAVNRALAGETSADIVTVHRLGCAQPYVVRVVAPRPDSGVRDYCLLMIVDPDDEPAPGAEIWRAMFDLTECELIIAEGLVSGQRINDIASQRGVSIETVRTQTKRMFERLNVSSQAEAAARLSRASPFRLDARLP